jgi:hypothetical protein
MVRVQGVGEQLQTLAPQCTGAFVLEEREAGFSEGRRRECDFIGPHVVLAQQAQALLQVAGCQLCAILGELHQTEVVVGQRHAKGVCRQL